MTANRTAIIESCLALQQAYIEGKLGTYAPAEATAPQFRSNEDRLVYYTLPMALNYRRPSHQLWEAAKLTYEDDATAYVFDLHQLPSDPHGTGQLQESLMAHRLALQPTRHTINWYTIGNVIRHEWKSVESLLSAVDYDFLKLRDTVRITYKKQFPYLSGPKLFNFWCYILAEYGGVAFTNKQYIDIAIDSHNKRASVALGVITQQEHDTLSAEAIADRWREILDGSPIAPTDLNVPLWYWSRDSFRFRDGIVCSD